MFIKSSVLGAARLLHLIALAAVAVLGTAALIYTLLSTFGYAPWLSMTATFGAVTYDTAGQWLQIGGTSLLCAMAFFLPTSARVAALEHSHRQFHMSMDDVARAYHLAHTADRAGLFSLSSEFDAVRERLGYLRDHPDLEQLEPDVLEVAAQMSQQARHLSEVYSDEKVTRAKAFLQQRQEEAERQQERIVEALHVTSQIRTWAQQVDVEESIVASQLAQLDEKLQAALPVLGYAMEHPDAAEDNVVNLPAKPAAE
ncbi:DNA repair protein [Yoonia sp. R2331]|uniref:DNA repair protein n=1 Tax=Yoonia sp. R2331 TaxID=3237238 RepID=UPI0034E4ADF6